MGQEMRLDKFLVSTGEFTRTTAKAAIRRGRVCVDGTPAARPEQKLDPACSTVTLDGAPVVYQEFYYFMMNKPAGYLSATEDRRDATVLDLLPEHLRRRGLFPVGRLDKDTEGLLLLTDDGPLAHDLLSPKKHVDKVYFARVEGKLTREDMEALGRGLTLGDGLECLPAGLEILGEGDSCRITLREGKYHQVKRMLAARGKPVTYLKRLSMGAVELDPGLAPGQWRLLTAAETEKLRSGGRM